jgi:hypothetical protein
VSAGPNWSEPAELYSSVATFKTRNNRYMRFPSVAEAIRFAIEEMPRAALRAVAIECGDNRYEGEAIRALYEAPDYPLQRPARS